MLLSDVSVISFALDDRWGEAAVAVFETPEDSNNGVETALTKCPMKLIPTYDKILDGGPLAKYVGIATMPRF